MRFDRTTKAENYEKTWRVTKITLPLHQKKKQRQTYDFKIRSFLGLTALVVALCFALSLFFAPLFLAIPAVATAPVLVVAGFHLFGSVRHISISQPKESIPAFLCILLMPITGSITDGIIFGLATYILLSFIEDWTKRFNKPNIRSATEAETGSGRL